MAEDPTLPLTDVQACLGHAQLTTTQIYLTPRKQDVIRRVLAHHERADQRAAERAAATPAPGYRPETWTCCSVVIPDDRRHGRGTVHHHGLSPAGCASSASGRSACRCQLAAHPAGSQQRRGVVDSEAVRTAHAPPPPPRCLRRRGRADAELATRPARRYLAGSVAGQRCRC